MLICVLLGRQQEEEEEEEERKKKMANARYAKGCDSMTMTDSFESTFWTHCTYLSIYLYVSCPMLDVMMESYIRYTLVCSLPGILICRLSHLTFLSRASLL